MEQRSELTNTEEWFPFLFRQESREQEWGKILKNFKDPEQRESLLQAFIQIPENDLKLIVARQIEDNFIHFFDLPSYEQAMCLAARYPRDFVEGGSSLP